jgi:hypothetical protein
VDGVHLLRHSVDCRSADTNHAVFNLTSSASNAADSRDLNSIEKRCGDNRPREAEVV